VIVGNPEQMEVNAGYDGFVEFAEAVGLDLEPFQRKIAKAAFEARELLVLLARGNGKSRLIGTLAVHHLLTTPKPAVYLAAASRDQARVAFEYAREVAMHPEVRARVTVRHLELRVEGGFLRGLASDAPKLFGLTPSLAITDEMQAFKDDSVYVALRTAVHKRPGAQDACKRPYGRTLVGTSWGTFRSRRSAHRDRPAAHQAR
jgi:phage terminase large subunit-like protein